MRTRLSLVAFWAALACIAFSPVSALAQPVFTGNAITDFANLNDAIKLPDPSGQDVGVPVQFPNGTISGWDIRDLYFFYDSATDVAYFGIDCYVICGDADGDGDPGGSSAALIGNGGTDHADLKFTESIAVSIDTDGNFVNNVGGFDIVIGVRGENDASANFSSFGVYNFDNANGSAFAPFASFGTQLPNTVTVHANPSGAKPDLEFSVSNFSTLPGFSFTPGEGFDFNVNVFLGSQEDDGIGEDYTPAVAQVDEVEVPPTADLELEKLTSNSTPNVREQFTYTLKVVNKGPEAAPGVKITDALPSGIDLVSTSGQGSYNSGTNVWNVGTVAVGTTNLTFTVKPSESGTFVNTAEITAAEVYDPDSFPGNNDPNEDDQDDVTITVPPAADVEVTKTVDEDEPYLNDNVTFTVKVKNTGPDQATGVVVEDALPAGLTYVSHNDPGSTTYNENTGVWTVGNLNKNQTRTLTITAKVTTTNTITNTAELTASNLYDPDSTPNNNDANEDDQDSADVTAKPWADLELTKTVDNSTPNLGDNVTFTLTVDNNGPSDAPGVKVKDVLPNDLQYVSQSGDGTYDQNTGVWTIGTINASDDATLDIVVKVNTNGTRTNTAEVSASGVDDRDSTPNNNDANEDDQDSAQVSGQQIDLELAKAANTATPSVNGNVVFTLTVDNKGPSQATGVTVTDNLPADLQYVSQSGDGTYDENTGVWTIGTINANDDASIQITAKVLQPNVIRNVAEVSAADQPDSDSTPGDMDPNNLDEDDEAEATVTGQASADLELTKAVDDTTPETGQNVTFTLTLTNKGPNNTTGVKVTDQLPTGLTFVSSNPSQGSYNSGTGVWDVGAMNVNQTETLEIVAEMTGTRRVTNTAEVTASDFPDPDSTPNNNDANEDDQDSVELGPQIDLELAKSVSAASIDVGSNAVYTLTVENKGPNQATSVKIKDVLPAEVQYVSASGDGSYNDANGLWTVGTLNASDDATIQLTVKVNQPGTIDNFAQVFSVDQDDVDSTPNDMDPNNLDEDDEAKATFTGIQIDLELTKTVDDATPNINDNVVFTITVENKGPSDATGITVEDDLPPGLTFVSANASQGSYNSGTDTWTVGNIDSGDDATLTLTAKATQVTPVINMARVMTHDQPDKDSTPGNNNAAEDDQASVSVQAQQIDLRLWKIVDNATPNVGTNVVYTLGINNDGPSDATGVQVKDVLPAGLTFVSANAGQGSYDDNTGLWTVGDIGNGDGATLDITVTVTQPGTIDNTAQVSAADQPDFDSTPNNNVASEDDQDFVSVTGQLIDLELTKTVSEDMPNLNTNVTYTITVANKGPSNATGVKVKDELPTGVQYVSQSGDGSYDDNTGLWTIGAINANDDATIDIVVKVTQTGAINNVAQVSAADQPDSDSTPNNNDGSEDDQDNASLGALLIDLKVEKNVNKTEANVGTNVVFTITVNNSGPSKATGVEVLDVLPAGLSFVSATATEGAYNSGDGKWTVGDLPKDETETLTLTATVTQPGLLTNTAQVSAADQPDIDSTPNNNDGSEDDQDDASVTGLQIDLELTKTVDNASPAPNGNVVFTITVENKGPSDATGVAVKDILPAGLQYVAESESQGDYNDGNGIWTVGNIANGADATLTLVAKYTATQQVVNTAEVSAADQPDVDSTPNNDDDTEDDQASAAVGQTFADLKLTKTVDNNNPTINTNVTFTITVENNGPNDATNVVVKDELPAGLQYVSQSGDGSYDDNTGKWTIGTIANGNSATIDLVAKVTTTNPLTNTAEVFSVDQPDPDSTPNNDDDTEDDQDSVSLSSSKIDLELTKTVDETQPNVGETVTFTIDVENKGPNDATGVEVSDLLPSGLTYVSHNADQGSYDSGTGVWTLGSLANGASTWLEIDARLTTTTRVVNTAQISDADQTDIDSTPGNNVLSEDDQDNAAVQAPQLTGITQPICDEISTVNAMVYDDARDRLYAGTVAGLIHVSTDNGANWPVVFTTDNDAAVKDLLLTSDGTLYAATHGAGVYRSTDGGETWTNIGPANGEVDELAYDANTSTLYGAFDGEVMQYNGSWSTVGAGSNPFAGRQVSAIAFDPNTGKLYASASIAGTHVFDAGTWASDNVGLPTAGRVNELVIDGSGNLLAATHADGIYKRGAASWSQHGSGLDDQPVHTLRLGENGELMAGTAQVGLYTYRSGTNTWEQVWGLPVFTVVSATANSDGELFAGTNEGIFRYSDNNADTVPDTWFKVSGFLTSTIIQDIVVTDNGDLFAASYGHGILYSNDGGQCWIRMNRNLGNLWTYAIEEGPDGTLWIGVWADGLGGVWRSVDGAKNWEFMGLGNIQIVSIAVDPTNADVIYAGANLNGQPSVYKSVDGGFTWNRLNFAYPAWSLVVDPNNSNTIYVGSLGNGIYRSDNGGFSWAQVGWQGNGLATGFVYDLAFGPSGTPYADQLFAGTARGAYSYDETSGSWAIIGSGLEALDVRTLGFGGSTIFAGTWGSGVLEYNLATNEWDDLGLGDTPILAFGIHPTTGTLIIGTDGGGLYLAHGAVTSTDVEDEFEGGVTLPTDFALEQNYPNPFNPSTTIPFALPQQTRVHLGIYDLLGREVAVLIDGDLPAGHHRVVFEAGDLASGTYLIRFSTPAKVETKTLVLLK